MEGNWLGDAEIWRDLKTPKPQNPKTPKRAALNLI